MSKKINYVQAISSTAINFIHDEANEIRNKLESRKNEVIIISDDFGGQILLALRQYGNHALNLDHF